MSSYDSSKIQSSTSGKISNQGVVRGGFFSMWNTKERVIIGTFLGLSFFIVVLGFFQFYQNKTITIADVFGVTPIESAISGEVPTDFFAQLSGVSGGDLSLIDTDKDGLSDYDELNVSHTSPYLEDTDGDTLLDKQELSAGSDPNCPTGSTCGLAQAITATKATQPALDLTKLGSSVGTGQVPGGTLNDALLRGELDPTNLRNFLKQGGISDEYLSRVDDATLSSLYRETLGSIDTSSAIAGGTPGSSDFNNLSATQIRGLMVEGGIEQSVVDQLSDTEVMEIYQETLSKLNL